MELIQFILKECTAMHWDIVWLHKECRMDKCCFGKQVQNFANSDGKALLILTVYYVVDQWFKNYIG